MISVTLFFFVGGAAAVLFRLELMTPRGDLVIAETYNKLFTLHGVIMVFFFLIPSIPTVLGNFLLPMMIGARDLAFPRLNLASWYIFMTGGADGRSARSSPAAPIPAGLSTRPTAAPTRNTNVMLMALGVFVAGFSSILTGLNFIVTTHTMRAPGLTWFRLPLFRVVALRDEPHHGARHAGDRDHAAAGGAGARSGHSAFSIRSWAAIRCCFSTCSGFTRTRPCTS